MSGVLLQSLQGVVFTESSGGSPSNILIEEKRIVVALMRRSPAPLGKKDG